MRRVRRCLFLLGMLAVAVVNLFADTCNTNPIPGLNICWKIPLAPNTLNNPLWPWCSPTSMTPCGYYYFLTGSNGWNSLNGQYGWHGYNGNGSAQAYLNTVTTGKGLSINLSSASSLHIGFVGAQYRNPTNDNGYYLSTANLTNTPGITMNFTSPVKDFSLYWGSVDTWNTITFTDTNGAHYSLSGSQIPSYNYWDPNGNNTTSILAHFSVPAGDKPWTQVSFSSCNATDTVCAPAFEFDNIEWVVAPVGCCSVTSAFAAVPEPSALLLLGSGFAGVAGWLRRRAPE